MDKKNLLGLVLITLIFVGYMVYNSFNYRPPEINQTNNKQTLQEKKDTANTFKEVIKESDSSIAIRKFGEDFSKFSNQTEDFITIETDLYTAIISSNGAAIRKWTLKKYNKWDKVPTQLIADKKGVLGLSITGRGVADDIIDTRNLKFQFNTNGNNNIKLSNNDSIVINATLTLNDNSQIIRSYTFYNGKYYLNAGVQMKNMDSFLRLKNYNLDWKNGLTYQEVNSVGESDAAEAVLVSNEETSTLNANSTDVEPVSSIGTLDYAAIKIKYFATAIIPQPFRQTKASATASGKFYNTNDEGKIEKYDLSVKIPYYGGVQTDNFRVYIGPLDYDLCEENGIEGLINLGWKIIRPIGEYFMLPFFKMIYNLVGNYGIAIILFSFVMKLLLYPLSIKQMQSVQKMKLINPELNKMRERYKDDQMKQQQETMRIYGDYGINPAGGCLPLLFQLPILYALWAVLSNVIDLRQTYFGLWITDLSQPDVLFKLPFSLLGLKHISGLALAMGVTMFLQQKQSLTDPRQKAMVYMMPIMFTIMFAYLPAGLNLYYFVFNLLSIGQQYFIENFSKSKLTLEDLKKAPKKESWMQKKMKEAQNLAEMQKKLPPGASYKDLKDLKNKQNQKNNNSQNKKRPNNRNNTNK